LAKMGHNADALLADPPAQVDEEFMSRDTIL
jgi:hypothetical protein